MKFVLLTNKQEKINVETNYYLKNDILNFQIEKEIYQLDLKRKKFIKRNNENIITIDIGNQNIEIYLLSNNYKFYMPMTVNTLKITENMIVLEYTFEGDVENTNCIIINY